MVLYDPCCFCVPLRLGSLVLAYLNLIQSYGGIIFSIFVIVTGAAHQGSPESEMAQPGTKILSIGAVLLIVFVLSFCLASILLAGIYGNKPNYVNTYVIYNCRMSRIIILLSLIFGLLGAIEGFAIIIVAFNYNSVIRSYHEKMLEESLCKDDTV